MNGLEFDEEQKSSKQKLSPDLLNKTLSRDDKVSSKSHVASSASEIEQVNAQIELPMDKRLTNEGRLTGRPSTLKDNQLSKSMAETSINRFKEDGNGANDDSAIQSKSSSQYVTPLVGSKNKLGQEPSEKSLPPTSVELNQEGPNKDGGEREVASKD